jgi:hypothetical protein
MLQLRLLMLPLLLQDHARVDKTGLRLVHIDDEPEMLLRVVLCEVIVYNWINVINQAGRQTDRQTKEAKKDKRE